MKDFAAIDFETANEQPSSVCSVGVAVIRNGEIAETIYRLIKPEPEYYLFWNTRIHGLSMRDTENANVFPYVWNEIIPGIEGLPLVAHNSAFDEGMCSHCTNYIIRCYFDPAQVALCHNVSSGPCL